jgi:four helix bundle protein
MSYANHFSELEVYILCRQLALEIFEISKTFPKEEMFSLTDQIRRSSRSIGGQIAESWGKRKYEKHFVSKLTDADGEQEETVHWLITSKDCRFLTEEVAQDFIDRYGAVHRMIKGMIDKSFLFCNPDG